MSVFLARLGCGNRRDLPRHSQMHEKRSRRCIAICRCRRTTFDRRETQQHEFAITVDGLDLPARKMLLERGRIIDKIRLTKPHGQYSAGLRSFAAALELPFRLQEVLAWRDHKQNNTTPRRSAGRRQETYEIRGAAAAFMQVTSFDSSDKEAARGSLPGVPSTLPA